MRALETKGECLQRAASFQSDGDELRAIPNQWYAVCYHYSAYHLVRAALLTDPIFSDPSRLHGVSADLTPDDRRASVHRARLGEGPRKPGVNDLVRLLYPSVAEEYVRLYGASVAVRYGLGLAGYTEVVLTSDFDAITDAFAAGRLVA